MMVLPAGFAEGTLAQFLPGFVLAALGAVFILWWATRSQPGEAAPVVGPLIVLSTLLGLGATGRWQPALAAGVLVSAAALPLARRNAALGTGALMLGALIVVLDAGGARWMQFLGLVAVLAGGTLLAALDRWWPRGASFLLLVSLVGIYLTVPETGPALVVLGAMTGSAWLAWPAGIARLGGDTCPGIVALSVWMVISGGQTRATAVVGGLVCLGTLVLEPIGRWFAGQWGMVAPPGRAARLVLAVSHVALVGIAARGVGFAPSAASAAVGAGILGVVGLAVGVVVSRLDAKGKP